MMCLGVHKLEPVKQLPFQFQFFKFLLDMNKKKENEKLNH